VLGVLDFLTGYQLNFSTFFLLPIFLSSWLAGPWGGIVVAVASAGERTAIDLFGGRPYPSPWYVVWGTVMRVVLFVVIALLVSVLRRYVDHERALARIDHLTGAANTRSFMETLKAEVERSRRYARRFTIAYFDLDNFKAVNDSFGHATGDRVLQDVVSIIRSHVRVSDIVARLGGDEFALLLPETDEKAARRAITKIQSQIEREMKARSWPVTVSIGALTCSDANVDVEELLQRADHLMYVSKMQGKKRTRISGD
jgi:diguanylate cyclase (GGDEF)-like protein